MGKGEYLLYVRKPASYMPHARLLIKSAKRRGKAGGGVAMHQHDVGMALVDHIADALDNRTGDGGKRLPRLQYLNRSRAQ